MKRYVLRKSLWSALGVLRCSVVAGLALGTSATILGLLAPWIPALELINHFRPFMLAGTIMLLLMAWLAGPRWLAGGTAVLAAVTLAFALVPLAYWAGPSDDGRSLKVVTLNLWVGNRDPDAVVGFLRGEVADVVVLQEAQKLQEELIARVRDVYPHVYCPDESCSLAMLSRIAPVEVGKDDVPPRQPLVVWARVPHEGRIIKVSGVHVSYPFEPVWQAQHVDWLIDHLRQEPGPQVIAGDFNLTPFSWKLLKLLHQTGMKAHLIGSFSWPANRWLPVVLLDNVISTPDIGSASIRTGSRVGSDHRPIIAEIGWR